MFGAPGSGKGTQGQVLGAIPRFFHLACGDVFRGLNTRTPLGQEFLKYSSKGELVPDSLTVQLWQEHIQNNVDGGNFKPDIDLLVLDGIPRNVEQAGLMTEHIEVIKLYHLSCPNREELAHRIRKRALKDNRLDDASEEVIARRFETYAEETKPVLEYYSSVVTDIDASLSPADVLHDILTDIIAMPQWKTFASLKT